MKVLNGIVPNYFKKSITKGIKIANTSSGAPVTVATVANHEEDDRFDGKRVIPYDLEYPNIVNTDTKPSEVPQLKQEIPFFSGSDFATLKEVVNAAEEHEIFWYNELDNYENYSYHLELFMVPKEDADKFNEFGVLDFEKTITGGWPEESVNKVTIAQSATTTEFNIDNLTLENLGTGSGSVAKMVGVDSHLSFDIIQIGNTNLNDTLHTFANLMGYPNVGTAVYFIKISYKGYDNDNPKNSTKLPIVKVIPFLITSYNELSTTTNATGTTTSLTGTAVNYIASTHVINTTKHDLKFDIKPTLNETLNSFVTELNLPSIILGSKRKGLFSACSCNLSSEPASSGAASVG